VTYYDLLAHPSFYQMLAVFDGDIAYLVHSTECCSLCCGKLDRANYPRSGHGMPKGASDDVKLRFSFCCRACRKRRTPDSLRFTDGRPSPGVVVTLLAVLQHGDAAERAAVLRKALGIDIRTLGRWRQWWREHFAGSPFWRGARGLLPTGGVDMPIPALLIDAFGAGRTPLDALVALARFLAPWRRSRPD